MWEEAKRRSFLSIGLRSDETAWLHGAEAPYRSEGCELDLQFQYRSACGAQGPLIIHLFLYGSGLNYGPCLLCGERMSEIGTLNTAPPSLGLQAEGLRSPARTGKDIRCSGWAL